MSRLVYHSPSAPTGDSPFDSAILDIASAGRLCIVSPYIDAAYLVRIVRRADHWRLLTDVEEWLSSLSLMARPTAWQFIRENIDRIHHCAAVHAKVVIGVRSAIIGSANLTRSGVLRRHEMAVVVDDQALVAELRTWFETLWEETAQPSIDETNAFVQWLDEVAAKGTTAQQRFVLSTPARRVRARLVAEIGGPGSPSLESTSFDLTEVAKNVVVDLQEHYESVDAAICAMLDGWTRSTLRLSEAVRKVRLAFPRARIREIYLLLIQHCANHPRSVFVQTTENRLVLKDGRFFLASRGDVLSAVERYDAFLCYLIQHLTFRAARMLPLESTVEAATGFVGAMQVVLVEELVAEGLLVMDDVPGELPRYFLEPNFDWDGRYLLFARSASVWKAAKASLSNGPPTPMITRESDVDDEDNYDRDATAELDRIWNALRADRLARMKPSIRPPSLDEALSRLLKALFKGTSFRAANGDALNASVSAALQIPVDAVTAILAPSESVPRVVRCVDDAATGCRIEVDPELTWDALAAYPRTREVCKQYLQLR